MFGSSDIGGGTATVVEDAIKGAELLLSLGTVLVEIASLLATVDFVSEGTDTIEVVVVVDRPPLISS